MAAMFAYIGDSSFVLMKLYGFSATTYGWIFGSNAAGFIIGSQVNRYILQKRDPKVITYVFTILMVLVAAALAITNISGLLRVEILLTLLFLFMFFLGFVNPNTQALALEPFSKNAGIASALVGSLRMFSGALATALISIFHDGTIKPMVWIICTCAILSMLLLLTKRKEIILYPAKQKA
jgi:DHA1 family bicyclomycin/chloramphenicol resistance-like MFS transporter